MLAPFSPNVALPAIAVAVPGVEQLSVTDGLGAMTIPAGSRSVKATFVKVRPVFRSLSVKVSVEVCPGLMATGLNAFDTVGIIGASNAPMSQIAMPSPLPSMGRGKPRWSTLLTGDAAHALLSPASMAGLPTTGCIVLVEPPSLANGSSSGSATGMVLPQLLSGYWRLLPASNGLVGEQTGCEPVVDLTIVFLSVRVLPRFTMGL